MRSRMRGYSVLYNTIFIYLFASCAWGLNPKIAENGELLVQSFEQFSQWGMNYLSGDSILLDTSTPKTGKSDLLNPHTSIKKAISSITEYSTRTGEELREKRDWADRGNYNFTTND
jgi:hypothetical protein